MDNHATFLAQKRFGSLDGLRAISILAVIWHHTAPTWASPLLAHVGGFGVTLFFAISGFLITTLLLRERVKNGAIDLKAFYFRRTLRIFPLYYGVVLLYIIVVLLFENNTAVGDTFFSNLIYYVTYTSNLFVPLDGRVIFYFSWSLAAEEQFYLIWPSLLFITGTLLRASLVLGTVLGACILGLLLGSSFLSAIPFAILIGSFFAITLHSKHSFYILDTLLGKRGSVIVLAALLALVFTIEPIPIFAAHLILATIVASCVINEKHAFSKLLSLRPIAYIGSISYGMYMLHMLSKNVVTKLLGKFDMPIDGLWVFFFTIIIATAAASFSFKYYEAYFLRLKHKYQR